MTGGAGFFDYGVEDTERREPEAELFMASASETDWSMLLAYGERRSVAAGEVIIEIGETGRSLVMVLAGSFKVMVPSGRRGRSHAMGTIQRGSVFGEIAFFDGAPRTSSVMAEERSDILVLEWSAFERLARVRPALAIEILADLGRILAARFRQSSMGFDGG